MPLPKSPCRLSVARGFTLIELLVSMAVLVLLVLVVHRLVSDTNVVIVGNRKHLDADSQARQTFERMALDFAKMVRRPDVDYLFAKSPLSSGAGGSGKNQDDRMFFYSEVPGFFDGTATQIAQKSPLSLVGYRINAGLQLERLGKLLTWDGKSTTAPGGIMFLSSPNSTLNPDPASTLVGNWPDVLGRDSDSPPYSATPDDGDYGVLAEQVFRLEVCYLLKPVPHLVTGSTALQNVSRYSAFPVATPESSSVTLKHNLTAANPPTASDDSGAGYTAGSRWYDKTNCRAYLCTENTVGKASWKIIGLQDVAGIVVALAVLDETSGRVLPATEILINNKQKLKVRVPDLTKVNAVFAGVSDDLASSDATLPDLSLTPPRLMAEAWKNTLNSADFITRTSIPRAAASQIRVYQRYFPLSTSP